MIQKLLAGFLYINFWLALGAAAITYYTAHIVGVQSVAKPLVLMVFLSTVFGYNFQRLLKYWKSKPGGSAQQTWILKNRIVLLAVCLALFQLMLVLFARHLDLFLNWWPEAIVGTLIVLLYSFPLFKGFGLRNIPGVKILLVAGTWTLITAWLPLKLAVQLDASVYTYLLVDRFLFIFLLCIPFDVRDLSFDNPRMKTLPQLMGAKGAIYFAVGLALVLAFLPFWLVPHLALPAAIVYTAVAVVVYQTFSVRSEVFYLLVIDGLILLQPGGYLLFKLVSG
jgi:hypothetical protein